MTAERWIAIQTALRQSHENLREAVLALNDERLAENAPQSQNSVGVLKKAVITKHRRAAI